jgi:hypothetical protein
MIKNELECKECTYKELSYSLKLRHCKKCSNFEDEEVTDDDMYFGRSYESL